MTEGDYDCKYKVSCCRRKGTGLLSVMIKAKAVSLVTTQLDSSSPTLTWPAQRQRPQPHPCTQPRPLPRPLPHLPRPLSCPLPRQGLLRLSIAPFVILEPVFVILDPSSSSTFSSCDSTSTIHTSAVARLITVVSADTTVFSFDSSVLLFAQTARIILAESFIQVERRVRANRV